MDIRVRQALDLMVEKGFLAFLNQAEPGKGCFYFFCFMEIELLPELWLNARPLFSAQLLDLIQQQSSISFQGVICPEFDLAGEDQFCRRFGNWRHTLCVAPHIYQCFWRSGEFERVVKQGLWLPSRLYWTEDEVLKRICNYIVKPGDEKFGF